MPIEREIKLVVHLATAIEWFQGNGFIVQNHSDIEQCYVKNGARVRKRMSYGGIPSYKFTWKTGSGSARLEIETDISKNDYEIFASMAELSLRKSRTVITHPSSPNLKIEFDRFYGHQPDDKRVHLRMIEIEHETGQEAELETLIGLLQPIIVHRVAPDDDRFSNYRLAEPYYALGLAGEIYGQSEALKRSAG